MEARFAGSQASDWSFRTPFEPIVNLPGSSREAQSSTDEGRRCLSERQGASSPAAVEGEHRRGSSAAGLRTGMIGFAYF